MYVGSDRCGEFRHTDLGSLTLTDIAAEMLC